MSYPKTPQVRTPLPSKTPIWRYSVKCNAMGRWAIFATMLGEQKPSWRAGFNRAPREQVLTTAAKVARGEIDPAHLIWREL